MLDHIRQRVHDLTAISLSDITITERPRLSYQGSNLYDVRFSDAHWIAKEFVKEDEFAESPMREFKALHLLDSLDIAPKPIDYLPYPEYARPVVLYEFMDGEMWDRRKPSPHELEQLAEVWLKTYTVTRDGLWMSRILADRVSNNVDRYKQNFDFYINWANEHFREGARHAQNMLALFDTRVDSVQKLDSANTQMLFSRSDPRFANIIARPDGRIGFVDWEDSGLRNPLRTISDLIYHANQEDLLTYAEWDAFLTPFFAGYPVQNDNPKMLFNGFRGITPLAWLGALLAMGVRKAQANQFDHTWLINEMPYHQRLQRYVAHALSWQDRDFDTHLVHSEGIRFFPNAYDS